VNIKATEATSAIFVLQVELKRKGYDDKNIIMISKLFGQKLMSVLHYENKYQLAIYETRLLKSDWKNEEEISLKLNGLDLGSVWDNFVTQVSDINVQAGNTLEEQINVEAEKEKLQKQIVDLELKARKEVQSKKKFEMVQCVDLYKERFKDVQ
jgi:regulator of replication initiation timing